jgi:SAM-dependent methyltransferase
VTDTDRRTIFGSDAELYDLARPGYLPAGVAAVLEYAALGDRPAVEIGAGTGKATVAFAPYGIRLDCVEPDPRMAAVLRRNLATWPAVTVVISSFEDWRPAGPYGLLYAAGCWHWLDPARRWDLVHAALAPGGTFAVLGNPHGLPDRDLVAELAAIDARAGVDRSPHQSFDYDSDIPDGPYWPAEECAADGRFSDQRSMRFREPRHYSAAGYVDYLASISAYAVLPTPRREAVLAEIGAVLERRGGLDVQGLTDVFLARRGG